jgi:hypothetical protein
VPAPAQVGPPTQVRSASIPSVACSSRGAARAAAYTNARLLTRPDTEWLRPEQTEDPASGVAAMGGAGSTGVDKGGD